jgi:hypothetical protein
MLMWPWKRNQNKLRPDDSVVTNVSGLAKVELAPEQQLLAKLKEALLKKDPSGERVGWLGEASCVAREDQEGRVMQPISYEYHILCEPSFSRSFVQEVCNDIKVPCSGPGDFTKIAHPHMRGVQILVFDPVFVEKLFGITPPAAGKFSAQIGSKDLAAIQNGQIDKNLSPEERLRNILNPALANPALPDKKPIIKIEYMANRLSGEPSPNRGVYTVVIPAGIQEHITQRGLANLRLVQDLDYVRSSNGKTTAFAINESAVIRELKITRDEKQI